MSDKQRADHVTAKYWNGFITRTEAQKVFDEQGQVITHQAMAIQKLDAVLTFIVEKFGITHEDINNWMKAKSEAVQKANAEAAKAAQAPITRTVVVTGEVTENGNKAERLPTDPSPIILTD